MSLKSRFDVHFVCMLTVLLGACDSTPPGSDAKHIELPDEGTVTLRQGFDSKPSDWQFVDGTWEHRTSDGAGVLVQTATDRLFPVALWKKKRLSDVDVTVRFKPISGRIDASGGIVFRAQDGGNYYI